MESLKQIQFLGDSRSDLKNFPREVRRALGDELLNVQQGRMPTSFKSMPGVGMGAYEIRVRLNGVWRIIYVAKFPEAIYILHAFQKKTQQTSQVDIDLAIKRYKMIGE